MGTGMFTAVTTKSQYVKLIKNPLFFIKEQERREAERDKDENSDPAEQIRWEEANTGTGNGYDLCVVDGEVAEESDETEIVKFGFHIASPNSINDWLRVVNSYIMGLDTKVNKYFFVYLLWFLDHCSWKVEQLKDVIGRYDIQTRPFLFLGLKKICRCLSFRKQQLIKEVLAYFDSEYEIYSPLIVREALGCITPEVDVTETDKNIFGLIDYVLEYWNNPFYDKEGESVGQEINMESTNPLIGLYGWLRMEDASVDYSFLKLIYPLVSKNVQLKIVKRYFHDIRLGKAIFDKQMLEQFRDNMDIEFAKYRYCLNTPCEPVYLGNSLLCDCVLTIEETKGNSFQSFNGVLDFAVCHCDQSNPDVEFGIGSFLPSCDGGAVYNDRFVGFIYYEITCFLQESKMTDDSLMETIRHILDSKARRKSYYVCQYDSKGEPLEDDQVRKCTRSKLSLDCIQRKTYEDKWEVMDGKDYKLFDFFLKEPLPENFDAPKTIGIEDVSIKKMRKSIIECVEKDYGHTSDGAYIVSSQKIRDDRTRVLFEYSEPDTMRIYPRTDLSLGFSCDDSGIKQCSMPLMNRNLSDEEVKETTEG